MIRFASNELDLWRGSVGKKPLVIRGARQVGKTWLVRDFAARNKLNLIELNMERYPHFADLFSDNNPAETIKNIEAELSITINPLSSCLFLDEIQAAPELFSKLRWFKEELPELPVIAAGSLLEFALDQHLYSMPVGRITFFHLEPMTFFEFLLATGNEALYNRMLSVAPGRPLPQPLHEKGIKLYQEFCLVGGMPEPLQIWIETNDIKACLKTQQDLLATYREDFHKYGREIDARLLNRVLLSVAEQLGNKFVYSMVDSGLQTNGVKKAIMLLFQAKLCSRIAHAAANGLPLGAQSNDKFFKALMVDVGLISALLGLSGEKRSKLDTLLLSNKGGIAEQFAGQHLRSLESPLMEPRLYYWQRTGGRLGEIDYIIQHGSDIVPIEVKSGTAGSMKSLHQFMAEKKLTMAVRFDMNHPSLEEVNVRTTTGQQVQYRLLSLPLYLVERVGYLLGEIAGGR